VEYKGYDPVSMDGNGQIAVDLSEKELDPKRLAYIHEPRVFCPRNLRHGLTRTLDQTFGKNVVSSLSTGLGTSLWGQGSYIVPGYSSWLPTSGERPTSGDRAPAPPK